MALLSIDLYVKALARKTKIDLVLPSLNLQGVLRNKDDKYYQNLDKKYPLLICLHGFGDDLNGWQTNCNLIRLCEEKGIAACFINGENKWYLNMGPIDDFYSLIERDVIDYLYGNFRCLSPEKPLAIAGVSMGGYGSLYHYLKNTDKYSACIALSPATKPDYIDESKYGSLRDLFLNNKDKKLYIYLSIGSRDFIFDHSMELNKFLSDNNIDCSYKVVEGADHSWNLWSKEIDNMIDYLQTINFIK